ncbi:MAG: hypothetical protein KC620_12515 [Myxococcales bacterium]|nr:hypothetical protein [Myxococcales bacterium]
MRWIGTVLVAAALTAGCVADKVSARGPDAGEGGQDGAGGVGGNPDSGPDTGGPDGAGGAIDMGDLDATRNDTGAGGVGGDMGAGGTGGEPDMVVDQAMV